LPRQAFRLACEQDLPALSHAVWNELTEVLRRPRLARFVDPTARDDLLNLLQSVGVWFEPSQHVTDCRDAKDNIYLELALEARATRIVSSDQDLLVLSPWRGVPILRPADYVTLVQGNRNET
jgi:putative PIN family toxin of toxin-antitoxin system